MAGQVPGVRLGAVQASHERRTPPSPPLRLTAIVDQQFSVKIDQYGGDNSYLAVTVGLDAAQQYGWPVRSEHACPMDWGRHLSGPS